MQLLLFYINLGPINPTPCISNLLNLNFKSFLCPAKIDVMAKTSTITVDLGNIFNICCLTTHNAGKIAVCRYHFKNLNVSLLECSQQGANVHYFRRTNTVHKRTSKSVCPVYCTLTVYTYNVYINKFTSNTKLIIVSWPLCLTL